MVVLAFGFGVVLFLLWCGFGVFFWIVVVLVWFVDLPAFFLWFRGQRW